MHDQPTVRCAANVELDGVASQLCSQAKCVDRVLAGDLGGPTMSEYLIIDTPHL